MIVSQVEWNKVKVTYLGDLFADGLNALKCLLADVGHLVSEFIIFTPLLLILGLVLFLNDILEQRNFADLVTVIVNNVPVVINLKTGAVT